MSAIRTFTVTVVSTGYGNKYVIDGVQQDTINLAEGYTYVFNYPSAHPFRFSTTSDGTHSGGVEYTNGVTVNGATQVEITVAASAPQLYYYCTIHSGMGGAANTVPSDTWGMLKYGHNSWGSQDDVSITLTGLSATTTVGTPSAFNETGWGADTWGFEGWGGAETKITLTGLTATTTIGTLEVAQKPGWGTLSWGQNGWGSIEAAQFSLTGLSLTSTLGTVTTADSVGLTGLSATTTLNSLQSISTDATFTLTGLGLVSSNGLLSPGDHFVGVSGLSATTAVGSLTPSSGVGLSGFSLTSSVGSFTISSDPVISLNGLGQAATTTLGTVAASPNSEVILSGLSLTSALGTLTTVQQTNGSLIDLGQSATVTLNGPGISFPGTYGRIVPKTSTGYTKINPV